MLQFQITWSYKNVIKLVIIRQLLSSYTRNQNQITTIDKQQMCSIWTDKCRLKFSACLCTQMIKGYRCQWPANIAQINTFQGGSKWILKIKIVCWLSTNKRLDYGVVPESISLLMWKQVLCACVVKVIKTTSWVYGPWSIASAARRFGPISGGNLLWSDTIR